MFQLVYISTSRSPVAAMLQDVLAVSRSNNDRADVTGLLIAGNRRFLQVLEGPEQSVLDTFARIKKDPRHHAFVMLTGRSVDRRAFGTWSMACEAGDEGSGGSLIEIVTKMTERLSDKTLRAHLVGFAELQRLAA